MSAAGFRRPGPRVAVVAAALLFAAGCSSSGASASPAACPTAAPTAAQAGQILSSAGSAVVKTNKGSFTITLYGDKAPIATANFVELARCGFYHGITFHRVLPGFVAQAGDPQTRTNHSDFNGLGTGGPGYGFAIEPPAADLGYDRYAVAMANTGQPDSNGSQFFIDLADLNNQLARSYTIFGKVVADTNVVDAIGQVPTNGARGVPLDPVIIDSITIQAGNGVPTAS
jgi:cyclophilin family peptidyl-prolyl cis-trans isomerase